MASYLIGYVETKENGDHEDPLLSEYTYGDIKENGRKLMNNVNKGDYLFFHKSIRNKRFITAYYIVEEVLSVVEAKENDLIMLKYKNPHLLESEVSSGDSIAFGNPITSNVLKRPLELSKTVLNGLSRKPNFNVNQTELASISSALRTWKELSSGDVRYLFNLIEKNQKQSFLYDTYLSSDEIREIDESDIEKFLCNNPQVFGEGLKLFKQQDIMGNGTRLDLLLINNQTDELIVVEIKKGSLGKEVYSQIKNYIKEVRIKYGVNKVRGIIVGSDILPTYEDFYLDKINRGKISVFLYGWKFSVRDYNLGEPIII